MSYKAKNTKFIPFYLSALVLGLSACGAGGVDSPPPPPDATNLITAEVEPNNDQTRANRVLDVESGFQSVATGELTFDGVDSGPDPFDFYLFQPSKSNTYSFTLRQEGNRPDDASLAAWYADSDNQRSKRRSQQEAGLSDSGDH